MGIKRRDFMKLAFAGGGSAYLSRPGSADAFSRQELSEERWGMLVDTPLCIGCRRCEWACKRQNNLPHGPLSDFDDKSVFEKMRRPDAYSYTVVNRFPDPDDPDNPVYVKVQCMHCENAACQSACLVGAFKKSKQGAVRYDAWKCMGCRYCMVACPFQIPAYEYENALTPVVSKCTFCYELVMKEGKQPACAAICPKEVMTFGTRSQILEVARKKIERKPKRYLPHIYGEHEVGGGAWVYLTSVPFDKLGLLRLGDTPVNKLNETIQHSIFNHFIPPIALFGLLGALMWTFKDRD